MVLKNTKELKCIINVNAEVIYPRYQFVNFKFKIIATSLSCHWVNYRSFVLTKDCYAGQYPRIGQMNTLSSAVFCFFHTSIWPRQNGRQFPDDIFKCIFLTENVIISIKISLKFVPKGSINNIPTLFQIMAWRQPGDKPLSEPMMVRLLTHICVTRPQWVNLKVCIRQKQMQTWNRVTE